MRRIYWDTMIHVYWFENNDALGDRVQHILDVMLQRSDILCSSLFTLSELIVGPTKTIEPGEVETIEEYFESDLITLLPYTRQAVRTFAELRAHHGVKPLDALHLAIAANNSVDLFLTHDKRLQRLRMPGLPFIASLETDLF
ncbi:type II toxin-antitoxin system VapC family toxin [Granulicella sibirica]|uniref:PIN domain-containing protein n=1 Tax=Granulicella sibirica TaxID=2479048 RepID=A0A4Q0T1G8_9BACT|nr:type II toxin-antitoxin system VapC family toxin [Granulicella sibirica]RXH57423.1 hypothetical protein GRAN_0733 [Granulicella sibirica]